MYSSGYGPKAHQMSMDYDNEVFGVADNGFPAQIPQIRRGKFLKCVVRIRWQRIASTDYVDRLSIDFYIYGQC